MAQASVLTKLFAPSVEPYQGADPITRFSDSIKQAAIHLDNRSREELEAEGRNNPDPVIREQALYQLIEQVGADSLPIVEAALSNDPDPDLRINVLWAMLRLPSDRCKRIALALMRDSNSRVQEWARVFCWERQWTSKDFRQAREATYREGRTFDQTIFLHIKSHLYIRLSPDNKMWGHLQLSPQTLARVYGQAMACPITETRERELVISKTLSGLHDDGTDHYESFLFKGFTERTSSGSGNFYFESNGARPFYLSGKADDTSQGIVEDVPVPFAREGQWFLNENLQLKGNHPIEFVRGLFQGWAYVNLDRIKDGDEEFLFPGNSILSTLHHPVVGPLTNAFIAGSFKGKVVDWDGDGVLDLNYLPAYATAKGEVDSDLDGVPDVEGRSVCARPLQ